MSQTDTNLLGGRTKQPRKRDNAWGLYIRAYPSWIGKVAASGLLRSNPLVPVGDGLGHPCHHWLSGLFCRVSSGSPGKGTGQ